MKAALTPRISYSEETEQAFAVSHNFSRDILRIDGTITTPKSTLDNKSFSENLYNDLLDKGMGSLEAFEKPFHMQ